MNSESIVTAIIIKGIDLAYAEIKGKLGKSKELARDKALNEQADLLRILNKKIDKIDEETQDLIAKNMQEPDVYETIRNAFSGVYKYSDILKTELTAELIWQRLTSKAVNNVNIQIINEAISKLEKLSVVQLNILTAAHLLELTEFDQQRNIQLSINGYEEWINGNLSERYFLERNVLSITSFANYFQILDKIKFTDADIFFIKSEGLADLSNDSIERSSFLYNIINATIKAYPKIDRDKFIVFAKNALRETIMEEHNLYLPDSFFRLNLNSYGLYIAQETYEILSTKRQDLDKEREVKIKYNQAQYEKYNAGLLGEGYENE